MMNEMEERDTNETTNTHKHTNTQTHARRVSHCAYSEKCRLGQIDAFNKICMMQNDTQNGKGYMRTS